MITARTFTTKDANGCEFFCSAFYESHYEMVEGKCTKIRDDIYVADGLGVKSNNLDELKKAVANI